MIKNFSSAPIRARTILVVSTLVPLIISCGDPREDVRIRLCKDIAAVHSGAPVTVDSADAQTKGYQHAVVRVRYSSGGQAGEAVCYYDYNAVEDTAQTLSDPLSAYAASPSRVTIDGNELSRSQLAEAVKQAMLNQGRQLIDRAKGAVQDAVSR
jgi:hypothetical protein